MSAPALPMRQPIRPLAPSVVERIAAGEVIERPASVVKELVENSLDASATQVTVRLMGGGTELLEVADNGWGIPGEELARALERHATSKLPPDGPIDRIDTLGFRGEALASVAAVAHLTLLSRPEGSEVAEGLSTAGGSSPTPFAAPRGVGTTVEVRELFFNTPARRKFLRSPAAEQVEIVRTLERLYLARPSVTIRVLSEGREVALLPAASHLTEAAAFVLGPEFVTGSFPLRGEIPGGSVAGALGHPVLAGPTSGGLYLSVNGRPIASRPLVQAVRLGYGDTIPRVRFPVGVVHLDLAPDRLDVNVHPTKREVRFARERELSDTLRRLVREALLGSPKASEPGRSVRPLSAASLGRPSAGTAPPPAARPSPLALPGSSLRPAGQRRLDRAAGVGPLSRLEGSERRPALELLGTIDALYWVASSDDGLVLIDQHAASERLLFESLRSRETLSRQQLVDPLVFELSPSERAALDAHEEEVRSAGFEVERFGPTTHRLLAVPTFRGRRASAEMLRELLRELSQGGRPTVPDALRDRVTATIACHAAVRAGEAVDPQLFAGLLRSLDRLASPASSCPHGRPIMVRLSRSRLDRWFLRQGA